MTCSAWLLPFQDSFTLFPLVLIDSDFGAEGGAADGLFVFEPALEFELPFPPSPDPDGPGVVWPFPLLSVGVVPGFAPGISHVWAPTEAMADGEDSFPAMSTAVT
ncbi:hypothetical protein D478_04291 [Brevibacillus agri BAB-2500]|nr:hypothetical protein D478_04291 [Brevibacillus agri BAB-2500]